MGERILLKFCRKPDSKQYSGATENYSVENALDFPVKMIPNFLNEIQGKRILDYGCGPGFQAVAMVQKGAQSVTGIDINPAWLERAKSLAASHSVEEKIAFLDAQTFLLDEASREKFDITLSCGSFEHFSDPATELANLAACTRVGGQIFITFAEPWLSPHGSHMYSFCKIPYVNVLFSEQTVMSVRSRFRNDGARRYEEVLSGLNRMTLAKFERIINDSGIQIRYLKYTATKNLPVVSRVPYLREFLTSAVTCVLMKQCQSSVEQKYLISEV